MAVTVTNLAAEPRSFSIGPLKVQIVTVSIGAADTSVAITADKLSSVVAVLIDSVQKTAQSISGNVATTTITAPGASIIATAIVIGK
jgi:hypothetical protein